MAGLVVRDNLRDRRTIQHAYLKALGRARQNRPAGESVFRAGTQVARALSVGRPARRRCHPAARRRSISFSGCDCAFVLSQAVEVRREDRRISQDAIAWQGGGGGR